MRILISLICLLFSVGVFSQIQISLDPPTPEAVYADSARIAGGGGGGSTAWGAITGTLSNQTDLNNALGTKLAISDTAGMLSAYLKVVDTAGMLLPYLKVNDTASMLLPYLNIVDTSGMLLPYLKTIDTANMLLPYLKSTDISESISTDTMTITKRLVVGAAATTHGASIFYSLDSSLCANRSVLAGVGGVGYLASLSRYLVNPVNLTTDFGIGMFADGRNQFNTRSGKSMVFSSGGTTRMQLTAGTYDLVVEKAIRGKDSLDIVGHGVIDGNLTVGETLVADSMIVNKGVNIVDDLYLGKHFHYEPPHGYMRFQDSSLTLNLTQNVEQELTNAYDSLWAKVECEKGFGFSGDSLTTPIYLDADYSLSGNFSLSFTCPVKDKEYLFRFYINSTEVGRYSHVPHKPRTTATISFASYLDIGEFTEGGNFSITVTNVDGDQDINIHAGKLYLKTEYIKQ